MQISNAWHYRIKAAQEDLIEAAGRIERAAEKSGYSKSEVGRWKNRADPSLMPINAVIALEADTGMPLVTAAMAELAGRRLSDPEAERASEVSVLQTHAELMHQTGELANTMAQAIADGKVTPTEAHAVDRVVRKLETAASELRSSLATVKAMGGTSAQLRVVGDGES
ncbi:MAG: phage regulatory CII family protein [Martelella sp.]